MQECILILDFGSQYTQLIARKVRENNVYCEIHPYNHIPQLGDNISCREALIRSTTRTRPSPT